MSWFRALPIVLLVILAPPAAAQGAARSMDFDVSVRSVAMGGASNALFWGDEMNHWGNPALTGFVHGIRYEYGRAQLIPGVVPDVALESQVVKLGAYGAGLVASGIPIPSGIELHYGDFLGGPTGFEDVDSWGFGVSAASLMVAAAGRSGIVSPAFAHRMDVGFGMNFKEVEVSLAPGFVDKTSAQDWGALLRVTPILPEDPETGSGYQLDLAYGYSVLSGNDDAEIAGTRVTRHVRQGISANLAIHPEWLTLLEEAPEGWLFAGLHPLISIGATADWSKLGDDSTGSATHVSGQGLEIAVMNVLALRVGHYRDAPGQIEGATWGFAVGIPVGRIAGLRYESAWTPQGGDLDHRHQQGFSLWVDPLAAWELKRKD